MNIQDIIKTKNPEAKFEDSKNTQSFKHLEPELKKSCFTMPFSASDWLPNHAGSILHPMVQADSGPDCIIPLDPSTLCLIEEELWKISLKHKICSPKYIKSSAVTGALNCHSTVG